MRPVELPERFDNQPLAEMSMLDAIRTADDLIRLQSIEPEFELFGNAYAVVCDYYAKNGDVPPPGLLATRFEGWEPQPGSFNYWFDQYQRNRKANIVERVINDAMKYLRSDPDKAAEAIVSGIQSASRASEAPVVAGDSTIWERVDAYKERVQEAESSGRGMTGIKTGFGIIDQSKVGWQPTELIGLMARPAVGKTWMLVRQAVVAWLQGKRVLFISTEMSREEILGRFDTVLAGHRNIGFSHRMTQELQRPMIERYEAIAELVAPGRAEIETRLWVVDRQVSVPDIETYVGYYGAEVVLVDNMMQLRSTVTGRQQSYEKVQDRMYGLRDLGLRQRCVIFVTHHTKSDGLASGKRRSKDGDKRKQTAWRMPHLEDYAYGDAFTQACSTVIGMAPDIDHENLRWYSVLKSRERGGVDQIHKAAMIWDVDRGVMIDALECGESVDRIIAKMREYNVRPG